MTVHQQADIEVVNQTGRTLLSVSLSHKYNDNYKNQHTWENIGNGETTATSLVDFNTGLFTTSRDWWVVSWVDDLGDTYVTDPHNFRDILDFIESMGNNIIEPINMLAVTMVNDSSGSGLNTVAAATVVTKTISKSFLNSEGTVCFKQHILRKEDCERPTKIIIRGELVEFNSLSGISKTGFRRVTPLKTNC